MFDDVYKDQMMDHPSRRWTATCAASLRPVLIEQNWSLVKSNGTDYFKYAKNNKTLVINLTHVPTEHCDYYISDGITPHQGLELYPEIFGIYAHDFEYQEKVPSKAFNCFINRGCPMRQSWFYFFVRNNMLDQAHVTFWCEDRYNKTSPSKYSQYLFEQVNSPMFEQEHQAMIGKIPYKNFDMSLEDAIMDSAKSLVIETFFSPNDCISYSEKTWRAVQMPRPTLLFSSQHAVRYLRDWGFDMFDDVVDHSYDAEPDPLVRQQMILSQLLAPVAYNADLFETRAKHNRNLLKSYQDSWPEKLKKITTSIQQLNNNESLTLRA